jgi:hypothetical protein
MPCSHAAEASEAIAGTRDFDRDLQDPAAPLSLDMSRDSRALLLAFGGLVGQIGIPPFEFFSLSAQTPAKRLFVRDLHQAWYHRGIPDHGETLAEVAAALRGMLAGEEIERLVVAGCSAGGYAALVFGTLLGADLVLSFAPQTVLDLDILAEMDDHRWDRRLGKHTRAGVVDPRFTDLREALPPARCAQTSYRIYFDENLRADRVHAERLAGLDGVRLYRFARGSHNIARSLRDSGALQRVLGQALGPPREPHSCVKFGHSPRSISG